MCTQQDDSTSTIKYFILADFQSYPHPSTYSVFNYYFACYTSQWITVTGFLPSMYVEHGIDLKVTGILVSIVVLANLGGTFWCRYIVTTWLETQDAIQYRIYSHAVQQLSGFAASSWLMFDLQFISAVLFTDWWNYPDHCFAITLQHAPHANAAAASAQFFVPPLSAALVSITQNWAYIAAVTASLSILGILMTLLLFKRYAQ